MAKGNIITIGDGVSYEYELPPMPSDEKLIDGYNLPKKEQIWRRPNVIHNLRKMPEKQKIEYVQKMRDKWLNGHWMFIEGEPVWITGMHWDFLVMNKFDFGYPVYLDNQRFDFYFRDLVRKDPRAFGKVILKCRRCGMTAQEMSEAIYTLIEDDNCNIGLQSNESTKCKQTLMHPLIDTYLSRPSYMREDYYTPNSKRPRNSLELISQKIDIYADDAEENDEFLGGKVNPYPTVAAAMDGTKKRFIIMDEGFKWKEASITDTLGVNKKCVVEYGIKGKVDVLSTMGDSDDVVTAVMEGCQLIRDSNPEVRNEDGRTISGLYEWFVSAIHSADIPEEHRDPAYTKFGKINKDKAEAYVNREVNKYPKDSKQRVFEMRRLPLKKSHGMMSASSVNYFGKIRIETRLQELAQMAIDQKPYVRGDLKYDKAGKVYFEHNAEGHWLIALHPYFSVDKNIDTRNRFRKNYQGVFFPPKNPEYCIGYDPIRYKKEDTTSKSLSKAAIIVYKKFDYFNSGDVNQYAALYLHRPDDPEEATRECIKACKYYGAECMHERTIETVKTVFETENCLPFLMKDPKNDKVHGIWVDSQGKVVKNAVDMMVTKFMPPKTDEDVDQIAIMPFEACLSDMDNFDITNTTKFDTFMAMIELEHGLAEMDFSNVSDVPSQQEQSLMGELYPIRNKQNNYVGNQNPQR